MIALLPAFLAIFALARPASAEPVLVQFGEAPQGYGLGVILGEPTGLSGIYRTGHSTSVDAALAWSIPEERLHVHGDYLFDVVTFSDTDLPTVDVAFSAGVGARVRLGWKHGNFDDDPEGDPMLGVRVPLVLTVLPAKAPLDFFVEIVPIIGLFPETEADLDGAIGVRVYFR